MPLQVNLCIPTQPLASLTVDYVQLPSVDGRMGVLVNHAPLRCILAPGVVMCRLPDDSIRVFSVSSGLAMIRKNVVTILADAAESAENIDPVRAHAARDRAVARLGGVDQDRIDRARAEAALQRAMARLEAVRLVGKH